LWGGREIFGLILASLIAGFATTPYAAFHFHRLAPYGVIANLLAMPVVSAWVMPMGILGVVALPFGFDAPFWRLMGDGIDWMTGVAQWVASLPGAVGHMAAFGVGPLLLATVGLLLVCLLRTRLRWSGTAIGAAAAIWAVLTPQPDVYLAGDGQAAAVRGGDGRLSILHSGRDTFAIREWLGADGDPRKPDDKTLSAGVRCDTDGCVARLADGRAVSLALTIDAFADDCARALVVVSPREAPGACQALLVDRSVWRARGAVALRINGKEIEVSAAWPTGYDRPWTARPQQKTSPRPPDATPPVESLEADD
jgi:competence protein ComEC